jgi:hypothetical protein
MPSTDDVDFDAQSRRCTTSSSINDQIAQVTLWMSHWKFSCHHFFEPEWQVFYNSPLQVKA